MEWPLSNGSNNIAKSLDGITLLDVLIGFDASKALASRMPGSPKALREGY
jgi:hypothetical protein